MNNSKYIATAKVTEAVGLKAKELIGGIATGELDILPQGGALGVAGKLISLVDANGKDRMDVVTTPSFGPLLACNTSTGLTHIEFTKELANGNITLKVDATINGSGETITGTVDVIVNKWLWKLVLKSVHAEFKAELSKAGQ
jgi:hypothetical protein